MKRSILILASSAIIAVSGQVAAQSRPGSSSDAILRRLELLEEENSALRERVQRLEGGMRQGGAIQNVAFPSPAAMSPTRSPPLTNATSAAQAAYEPPPPAAAPTSQGWTGFYAGGHGGYGWERESFAFPTDPTNVLVNDVDSGGQTDGYFTGTRGSGAVFGGQFGYNWQLNPNWVTGFEADFSSTKIKGSQTRTATRPAAPSGTVTDAVTLQTKISSLGTVRGKLGFLVLPDVLISGTAGLAWGQVEDSLRNIETVDVPAGLFVNAQDWGVAKNSQFGWVAGTGVDWKLGSNLMLGALYLHHDLGEASRVGTRAFFSGSPATRPVNFPTARVTSDTITARVSWLFAAP